MHCLSICWRNWETPEIPKTAEPVLGLKCLNIIKAKTEVARRRSPSLNEIYNLWAEPSDRVIQCAAKFIFSMFSEAINIAVPPQLLFISSCCYCRSLALSVPFNSLLFSPCLLNSPKANYKISIHTYTQRQKICNSCHLGNNKNLIRTFAPLIIQSERNVYTYIQMR
jgi:hypothetical protein